MDKKFKLLSTAALLTSISTPSLAGWEVQWIDKFEGSGVDWDNWTAQTEANYNNELQCYTDDDSSDNRNYEVSDGTLKIIARKNETSTYCSTVGEYKTWTSGRLNTKDKQEFLYGRIESRIRFHDLDAGTWPAFWMLENRINQQPIANDDDFASWPNFGAGEIDIWEWFANEPDLYITNFFNNSTFSGSDTGACGSKIVYNYPNGSQDVLDWHVYAMEWEQDQIDFYIDDVKVATQDMSGCTQYQEDMFVLINLAMGGNLGGDVDANLTKATLEIDYVAHCKESASSDSSYCNEEAPLGEDGTDPDPQPEIENAYIAYSGEDDTFGMTYWGDTWGTGTSITQLSETYEKSYELTPGTGWGASWAVMAWGNDVADSIDISDYSVAKFKVKSGSYDSVKVSVQNGNDSDTSESVYQLANGTDLGNGWVEISASLPKFTGMTWLGLMFEGTATVQIADVYLLGSTDGDEDGGGDDGGGDDGTPEEDKVPSGVSSGGSLNVFVLLLMAMLVIARAKKQSIIRRL
ncbi:glycoside hydrolase family 16 protein [Vibrio hippocampi]|uniref:GH16 domain-containing protein n=1 Tax=Vibrio hippocampi TaxID=654686 RepID=A0ABN8DKP7_9VIBR|nr:glycoside hydrolase family 16 protein [Vibrio hippocampi]CAH0529852.1 hypothetical protein VHP8226_03608 [Vibrio hippocampi]